MAFVVPVCDTDIATAGALTYTNNGQARCDAPGATLAWIEVDSDTLGQGVFPPLTYQEGFEISGGIIALWALCWVARMLIQTIRQTRYG